MNTSLEILVFEVGGERHGLATAEVREVLPAVPLVRVEGAPRVFEGIINLRGRVVPVIDLRAQLGLPTRPVQYTDHLIVAEAGKRLIALRVDRTVELAVASEIEDAQEVVPGLERSAQVAKLPSGMVMVHTLGDLLQQGQFDWRGLVDAPRIEAAG